MLSRRYLLPVYFGRRSQLSQAGGGLSMARLVDWLESFASSLGGAGLFFVAFLDSSFVSLPEINDVLVVMMVIRNEALMPYYAGMATAGSMAGCLVLYALGRKGGDALLRRWDAGPRLESAMRLFERFGVLAVVVAALLPPPAPFKVFVLLSGVTRLPVWRFLVAVSVGRGVRYFGEGALAVRYGDQALEVIRAHGPAITGGVLALVLLGVVGGLFWHRARA